MTDSSAKLDVFLSFDRDDRGAVERIARALEERGLTVSLDPMLVAEPSLPNALEGHLGRCRSAIVVLGSSGMGRWQKREQDLALKRQARDGSFGVIPVVLPNADPPPGFGPLGTWVDLRGGVDDPKSMDLLASAVRAKPVPTQAKSEGARAAGSCPYVGLRPFREEDAPLLFGRAAFVEDLVERISAQSVVAVVGPAGSGKTSILRAGLIPRLRSGLGEDVWAVVLTRPGDQPLRFLAAALLQFAGPARDEVDHAEVEALAVSFSQDRRALSELVEKGLARQATNTRLLLVFDQWEELYLPGADTTARGVLVDQLLAAIERSPVTLLLTVRAETVDEALADPALGERLADGLVQLPLPTRSELAEVIRSPAAAEGIEVEAALVDRLLDDAGPESGNLLRLQLILYELWSQRQGNRLTLEEFDRLGGLPGILAGPAESFFAALAEAEQAAAERLLLRLVQIGFDGAPIRRRVPLDGLAPDERTMVDKLSAVRLLVVAAEPGSDRSMVELAHEALIDLWPRLRHLAEEHRSEIGAGGSQGEVAVPLGVKAEGLAKRIRGRLRRLRSRWPPKSLADLDRLPTPLLVMLGLIPAAVLAWLVSLSPPATALLVLLIPAAAIWQGRRVRVVWEHGIPAEREEVPPVRRRPVVADVAGEPQQPSMEPEAPAEPQPPYPLHDPLIELMALPGGTFWMGSDKALDPQAYDDELSRREVGLAPYAMAIAPITRGLYLSVKQAAPEEWEGDKDDDNLPANYVSWEDGVRFCNALSQRSGLTPCYREAEGGWACDWEADGYRLPTEAEWEYACRAGTETPWFWGVEEKDADRHAWYARNSGYQVNPVRAKTPNHWDLHDMAGNVWEWCWDWYAGTYDPKDLDDPRGSVKGAERVLRGGSFDLEPRLLRSAVRLRGGPGFRDGFIGFRCVRGSVRQLDH